MNDSSPAQRTAGTARILMTAGVLVAAEAVLRGSAIRTLIAAVVLAIAGGLLFAAKRAD